MRVLREPNSDLSSQSAYPQLHSKDVTVSYSNPLLFRPNWPLPKTVAVIGAGTIGPDIGYYLKSALPDLNLFLVDVDQSALDHATQRFHTYAKKAIERGKMSEATAKRVANNLHTTLDYENIRDADWVIEAATENLALKRRIFSRVEIHHFIRGSDHLEYQLAACGSDIFRASTQRACDGHAFLCARLAQPGRRNRALVIDRSHCD